MIGYYFEGNDEFILQAFKEAKIPFSGKLAESVEEMKHYLMTEYNAPFKGFLELTSCDAIASNDRPAKEFVDEIMLGQPANNAALFY